MLFSRRNPPPGFYHYLYLREDGTPYYSGKGKGGRAWSKNHVINPPTDPSLIVITHWGLTELWALALERWHIRWYGRKDLETGILRNGTDGGEGFTGPKTKNHRKNIGLALKNVPKSKKHRENMSVGKKGVIPKDHPSFFGSENYKNKMIEKYGVDNPSLIPEIVASKIGSGNGRFDHVIYEWKNVVSGEIIESTRYDMIRRFGINKNEIIKIIKGARKTPCKDWICITKP